MLRSSKTISRASRKIRMSSQERQPGWVNSNTRVAFIRVWMMLPSRRILVEVFDLEMNLGRFLQHGRHGTVFLFGEADGVFHRFARHFTANPVRQPDCSVDLRILFRTLSFGADFEAGERLALLAQDADHVRRGAAAERDQ